MMMIYNWKLTALKMIRMITNSGHGISRPTAVALEYFMSVEQGTGKHRIRNENVQ
jgi:hypothetical protein